MWVCFFLEMTEFSEKALESYRKRKVVKSDI